MLKPLLLTLYTHDCIPAHFSNSILMFTGDTTIARLISVYRVDVEQLAVWCTKNNLV